MNTAIVPFDFNGSAVRVIHIGDQPWWVAADIADLLGYRIAPHMMRMLDDDQKGIHLVDTLGGVQEAAIVNESGLWTCVVKSKKPEAKPFQRWLTGDLLPTLRRQGFYIMPGARLQRPASVTEYLRVGNALKLERSRLIRAGLWERLDQICDSWQIARLPHDGIGYAEPDYAEELADFWAAVAAVDAAGIPTNHSRSNDLIALNLPELAQHFAALDIDLLIDRDLRAALRHSITPRFVDMKKVNSRDGRTRSCWVFRHVSEDEPCP